MTFWSTPLTLTVTNWKLWSPFFNYLVFNFFIRFFLDKRPKRKEANITISTDINTLNELLGIVIIAVTIITMMIYINNKTKIV